MKSVILKAKNKAILFGLFQLIIGSIFIFINPPFQGPDEINHLYRAYAVSQGQLTPDLQTFPKRRGGLVPQAIVDAAKQFSHLRWYAPEKTSFTEIHQLVHQSIDYEHQIFKDYPNTAVYPFLVYLPSAFGLKVAKFLSLDVLHTIYLTRFSGLFFWCMLSSLAIWLLPVYRILLAVLMLLPMAIYTHGLITADTFVNAISFLFIAFILRKTASETEFTFKDLGILICLTFFLVGSKMVYTPLLLLAMIIPKHRFKVPGGKILAGTIVAVFAIVCFAFWSNSGDQIYLPYSEYNPSYLTDLDLPENTNVHLQKELLLSEPTRITKAAWRTLSNAASMYIPGYIGTFGWLDTDLSSWIVFGAYLFLFLVIALDRAGSFSFNWGQRGVIFLAFSSCWIMVVTSQLLAWEQVGSMKVGTIQGRYILPIIPLLALLFSRGGQRFEKLKYAAFLACFILLILSLYKIHFRYYQTPNDKAVTHLFCNAEQTRNYFFVDQDNKTLYRQGGLQSKEEAYSGLHSIKLGTDHLGVENFYGASIPLYDCHPGDTVQVQVRHLGMHGGIVIKTGDLFRVIAATNDTLPDTWHLIDSVYVLDTDFEPGHRVDVFLYNPNEQNCYFDDLKISYLRKEN